MANGNDDGDDDTMLVENPDVLRASIGVKKQVCMCLFLYVSFSMCTCMYIMTYACVAFTSFVWRIWAWASIAARKQVFFVHVYIHNYTYIHT